MERRADYIQLSEIHVQLAVVIAELRNVTAALVKHQIDDEKVECRVRKLEEYKSILVGGCAIALLFGTMGGFLISQFVKIWVG